MRESLIKIAGSSAAAVIGMLLLLIFIAAMKHPQQQKTYTYLALGDSYTIGEKVKEEENFPNQSVALLREKGLDVKAPVIVGKTGWTTDELEAGIKKAKLQSHYDFVSLLIGVNNQYRERPVEEYKQQFETLLKRAIRFAYNDPSHVIVLSIPDWGVTPFAEERDRTLIANEIDSYNAANKFIADKYKVHYIDVTTFTREASNDTSLLAEDGLHPSGKEYRRWAILVANRIYAKK